MVKQLRTLVLLVVLATLLGGCVIAVRDGGGDGWHGDADDWKQRQQRNEQVIASLELGRPLDSVIRELGTPDMTESFVRDGREFRVLFYRTRLMHEDGRLSRDETTPLVFVNDELVGWGESAVAHALP